MRKTIKPNLSKVKSFFQLGYGTVHIGYIEATYNDTKKCGISLTNSEIEYKIGEDTTHKKDVEDTECLIYIDNIESLNVLQDRINKVRDFLENNNNNN